ncbi:flavin-dependent oxidoreductase [Streptomyces sp. N2-109]|uniref:Flavin-dependent oxidoreductase n=1 Tax=Streptomyces gossypii TaxID=2883101 RepID=A0ABT2JM01_9ACTN|nr:flavin-dependent oxidoreductase [Streptomyces gossypii]MCT2588912.1 flavin-dependent oxidoreductase [Streptomyces gossypii]
MVTALGAEIPVKDLRVLIVGAGIGGLSTALSLHAAGVGGGITVVDASERLLPVGAGINLQPHAVRELTELGLGEQLAAVSAEPRRLLLTDRHGNRITAHPRGRFAGYRWPQLSVHRGELQRILLDAVKKRLGPGAVRTALTLEGFEERADGVTGLLRDRGSSAGPAAELDADVLIGADGLHSAVRRQLHPGEGEPCWNGIRMWRGVTHAPPPLDGSTMIVAGSYRPARVVVYPLGDGQVNWVAEVRLPASSAVPGADWSRQGRLADVLPYFEDWRIAGLDIAALLRGAPSILDYPMVDRDPLSRWGRGRVTLLGDAAHPMLPVGSNGGSQAVLDARVFARELARELAGGSRPGSPSGRRPDPAAALRAYETERLGPANEIASACRDMPSDRVLNTVAERAPDGFRHIGEVLTAAELTGMREGMRRTTDMDVSALNSRPSWSVRTGAPGGS